MSEPSISFRLQAVDARGLTGQRRHDQRVGKQPSYVDPRRTCDNRQLFCAKGFKRGTATTHVVAGRHPNLRAADTANAAYFVQTSKRAIEDRAVRRTSTGKYWRTAILTFSHEAQARLAEAGRLPHEEAKAMFEDFAARHDVRLLSVDFHGDESAPHYHASFEGVNARGYALRLDRQQLSAEQDLAASHFAGLGLTRGRRRKAREDAGEAPSKWVNRTVRELHEQLPGELVVLEHRVEAAREKAETNEARASKAQADLDACHGDAEKVRKRMETYEVRAARARTELSVLEAKLTARRDALASVTEAVGDAEMRLDRLTDRIEVADAALAQKKTTIERLRSRLRSLQDA